MELTLGARIELARQVLLERKELASKPAPEIASNVSVDGEHRYEGNWYNGAPWHNGAPWFNGIWTNASS